MFLILLISMTDFFMIRKTALLKDFSNLLITPLLTPSHLVPQVDLLDIQHVKAQ